MVRGAFQSSSSRAYFRLLSDYFNTDLLNASSSVMNPPSPYQCLESQAIHGWRHGDDGQAALAAQQDEGSKNPRRVAIEMLGVEGAGHHAVHSLFGTQNETGNSYIEWRGASWPAGGTWRNAESNRGHPFEANFRSRPTLDMLASLEQSHKKPPDFWIILARVSKAEIVPVSAPGRCPSLICKNPFLIFRLPAHVRRPLYDALASTSIVLRPTTPAVPPACVKRATASQGKS